MARLTIRLLGPFHVTLDGEPITNFESNKVRALLACLAMEPHHPHSRETLAGLLWPDHPEETARHNLRQALSNLRQAIRDRQADPPFLRITRGTVQFNPDSDYHLDAAHFDSLVAASDAHAHTRLETCKPCIQWLEQAVELYGGDFLEGLFVGDSVSFEEWALLRRERFHRLALDKLYHLANHYERRRDYSHARHYARRQVELEPWREEAHQQLMRLLAHSGQRSTALAQYERCRRVLAEELGVEPDEQTQALYERIRAARSSPPHNLPTQLTPFFGRQEDLAEIAERLANPACRLLTLLGPGGIGKTRLALHAAAEQVRGFLNGIFFVPLAAISSPRFLAATIAEAVGFVFSGEQDPRVQLLNYLRGKEMLLVLDNFEHLLTPPPLHSAQNRGAESERSTDLLVNILTQAPCIKILATSRESLNLRAEWLLEVQGLALPEPDVAVGAESYSAVQLFVETARRVDASFALAGETAPSAIRICHLLEGMPLGIELAAAAVRAYPCEQIAAQIEQDLDFLSTSMRDVPARHRSMRAVFDHSWRLLTRAEQEATEKLSVFRDPFRPEAARAVAGAEPDMLMALAARSFLSPDRAGRYNMHQLLKQYSAHKLEDSPRQQKETRTLHCRYYADFLHRLEKDLIGIHQQETVAEIGAVIEDVRAAWEWGLMHQEFDAIGRMQGSLYRFYLARNWFQEGAEAFEQATKSVQAAQGEESLLLVRIWTHQAEFYAWRGRYDPAKELLQRSITICRASQVQQELATTLTTRGLISYWLGEYATARECFEESLSIARQVGDTYTIVQGLNSLANIICDEAADFERAGPLYEESLALARQIGDRNSEARVLINQGALAHEQGDYAEARRLYQESLELYRALDNRRGISAVLNNLGQVARLLGEYESARALVQESLDIKRETGNRTAMVNSLMQLGNLACTVGEYEEASRWYGQALTLAWDIQALHMVRYLIHAFSELSDQQGKPERALELLFFLQDQPIGEQSLIDQVNDLIAKLEEKLSPDTVAQCREHGQAVTLDAVVADILGEKRAK